MNDVQDRLDYGDAVAEWFIELGEAHINRGALEEGLQYTHIAATVLWRQNRTLSSPRIEANLCRVAARLPARPPCPDRAGDRGAAGRCLHVLSEAFPAGGLTAMATRWILNDRSEHEHHVALLAQRVPVPHSLAEAARSSGGEVHLADPDDSFTNRAVWLRNLANDRVGYVILHVDVCDVISGAAFGLDGGPRVFLVNHTAHLHWIGASVTDLVVNCRGSALEGTWAATHRGVPRYATVPIPLEEPKITGAATDPRNPEAKRSARRCVGVPEDAVVIMTVGARFKYLSVGELDFVKACERVLEELPGAIVLAVGFKADERWSAASTRTGSRIRMLGRLTQEELAALHTASDIYIEGFPFGTTTSLLEAGLRGLPAVLAPAVCPPPFGSDGVALDDVLTRPATVTDYEREIVRLGRNPAARELEGERIRRSIAAHHTGAGWRRHLDAAFNALPGTHAAYPPPVPQRTPKAIHEYWFQFQDQWAPGYEQTLENAVQNAYVAGLKPRLNAAMLLACRKAAALRAHRSVPLPLLVCLCNYLLPLLPATLAGRIFRGCAFFFRGALLSRIARRMRRLFAGSPPAGSPYEEYRRVPEARKSFLRPLDAVSKEQGSTAKLA